jgi:hypothetical protein
VSISEFVCVCIAAADIILWRRKEVSAAILGVATAAWGLFEVAEYHFLTLACYAAMIAMLTFFIWTNASAFLNLYGNTHFFSLPISFQTFNGAILHLGNFFSPCNASFTNQAHPINIKIAH